MDTISTREKALKGLVNESTMSISKTSETGQKQTLNIEGSIDKQYAKRIGEELLRQIKNIELLEPFKEHELEIIIKIK